MRVKYLARSRCLISGSCYYCPRWKLSILGNLEGVEVFGDGRVIYQGRPDDGEVSKDRSTEYLEFLGPNGLDLIEQ